MADLEARQRARRIVQERGLASLANDTKWREFFALLMAGERIPLEFKFLHEDESQQADMVRSPVPNYIEGGDVGPELFVFIEWVRSSVPGVLQVAASMVGLECAVHDGTATVYGYR